MRDLRDAGTMAPITLGDIVSSNGKRICAMTLRSGSDQVEVTPMATGARPTGTVVRCRLP